MNKIKRSDLMAFIESVKALRDIADDRHASIAPAIYPKLKYSGALIKVGTKINFDGCVKRARVDLWDTKENSPLNAPDLWEDLLYKNGLRVLSGPITAENPVGLGEQCWFEDKLYESLIANNVWLPSNYPAGWKLVH